MAVTGVGSAAAADPVVSLVSALNSVSVVGLAGTGIDTTGATDSTTAINVLLSANPGKVVRGVPGASYLISAPLVAKSGTTLDMTGCTITLAASSNCNMVQNAAVGTATRILDAVMTASSGALASATIAALGATAVNALVGKAVTVQGAGVSGVPLTTTVSAVTGSLGTYGLTLTAAASTSVTGQYAAIGTRDSSITVTGGSWDRAANNGSPDNGVTAHNFRFRHVDGLVVRDTAHLSTSGKYGINPGDCTRVRVIGASFVGFSSDGVHFNGPVSQVIVRDVTATSMHDDLVSFTARDSTSIITDCAGNVTDVLVDGASYQASTGTSSVLKLIAGKTTDASASYTVGRITARNLTGPNTGAPLVYVGDSSLGTFDDLLLEDVRSLGGTTSGCVILHGGTIDRVTVRRPQPAPGDSYAVAVDATVIRLAVEGGTFQPTGVSSYFVSVSSPGVVTSLVVDGVQAKPAANNCAIVRASSGTISRVQLVNCHVDATGFSGMDTIRGATGSTLSTVQIANLVTVTCQYPLGTYAGTTTVTAAGVTSTGMTGWIWLQNSAAVVTVLGASGLTGNNDTLAITAGASIRLKSLGIPCDIGTTGIAKNAGDMAYNTSGSRSCGIGPVVSDGTNWKGLYSGATF